ncbi:unnamed protein product [Allacma fusca]|uniref:cholesterol 7-desaturase n=1 Tax=Allacma fusca TaxID=39272 RepID=A0A8J2LA58_9HEXA|nr:unnamed protein product [Allacma fusca]
MSILLATFTDFVLIVLDQVTPWFEYDGNLRITVSVFVILTLWYYLFWKPFDWYRDFTDYGYDNALKSYAQYSDTTRKNVINELRQRRKIGELPPVYPNGWFAILESDQLGPQKVTEVNVLGLNLVAWRGASGTAYVADAYCPHLGAHLGVGGKVSQECITCPFHGWEFEGPSGRLTKIPYSSSTKPEFAKINTRRSLERNGFIYLWYHAEDDEPTWFPEAIPEIQSQQWVYRGRSEFRVACHIQEMPENGADINHLNVVHVPAMLTGGTPDNSFFSWSAIKHVWSGQWKPSDEKGKKHVAILDISHHIKIFNTLNFMKMDVRAVQIGPGLVHLEFNTPLGRGVLFHTVTPLEPLLQRVSHRFYTSRTFIHPWAKLILLGEAIMIARDISIWNRKTFMKNPALPKEDAALKRYRLWYSQFYSENSPRQYFSKNDTNENSLDF